MLLVLAAFAGNSILCRLALRTGAADPVSFTALRLVSGAIALTLLASLTGRWRRQAIDWAAVLSLFVYAYFFSIAYVALTAGTGALILFAVVQATLISRSLVLGERPTRGAWAGLVLALLGLGYLVAPGVEAPPPLRAVQMALAGLAWGIYSIRGMRAQEPVAATARNFLCAAPLGVLALGLAHDSLTLNGLGLSCALASGAITSGLGYALWYLLLPSLPGLVAASAQLAVPLLATLGGVLLLGEAMSWHLLLSGLFILGGIGLVIAGRDRTNGRTPRNARQSRSAVQQE